MKNTEKRLLEIYRALPGDQREALLQYAEFVMSKAGPRPAAAREPVPIPRPEQENVIQAIRRLTATYPMLAPDQLLHETSRFMSEHVMQGRGAGEVIDDLETLFAAHYRRFLEEAEG